MKYKKSYFLIGQKAIITNNKKEILLLRRSSKTPAAGRWDFVGGGLDDNDNDPISGIKREIREETSLNISKITPINLTSHFEGRDRVILIFYWAASRSSKVKLSWEHDDFVWVSKKKALKMKLPQAMKLIIRKIS